ncbi:hypothetical protein GCM10009756_14920 [Pseudokineococcus marinus]
MAGGRSGDRLGTRPPPPSSGPRPREPASPVPGPAATTLGGGTDTGAAHDLPLASRPAPRCGGRRPHRAVAVPERGAAATLGGWTPWHEPAASAARCGTRETSAGS